MNSIVPAYFHPLREAHDWRRLLAAGPAAGIIIINPDTGPGPGDVSYRVSALGTVGLVAGYIDTAYGTRSPSEVRDEAAAYRAWYGVTAMFADRVTSSGADLRYYRELALGHAGPLLLNPGVRPDPGYLDVADVVVTFEGTRAAHVELAGPEPRGRARTCHLVHGVPVEDQVPTLARASARGAAFAYATEHSVPNPWGELPLSWPPP